MKNKRGWLKILEVFMAILLLASILTIILSNQSVPENKKTEQIYKQQAFALRKIQLDDALRKKVLESIDVQDEINKSMPSYLDCKIKNCLFGSECNLDNVPENKDVYVKSILITTNGDEYETRELKLFCWEKD